MRVLFTLGLFFILSVAQCEWGIQDPTTGAIYNYSLSSLQGQLINVVEEATGQVATVHFCGIAPRCTSAFFFFLKKRGCLLSIHTTRKFSLSLSSFSTNCGLSGHQIGS